MTRRRQPQGRWRGRGASTTAGHDDGDGASYSDGCSGGARIAATAPVRRRSGGSGIRAVPPSPVATLTRRACCRFCWLLVLSFRASSLAASAAPAPSGSRIRRLAPSSLLPSSSLSQQTAFLLPPPPPTTAIIGGHRGSRLFGSGGRGSMARLPYLRTCGVGWRVQLSTSSSVLSSSSSSSSSLSSSNERDDAPSTTPLGNNNGDSGSLTPDRAARIEEARALRERARLLLAEASEAERVLGERRRADREGSDAKMDTLLEELSAPPPSPGEESDRKEGFAAAAPTSDGGTGGVGVDAGGGSWGGGEDPMVGRIRDRGVPISARDFVGLIDRLYERERAARGAAAATTRPQSPREFNIGSMDNGRSSAAAGDGESFDPAEAARLNAVAVRLLRAVDALDREEEDRWLAKKREDPDADAGVAADADNGQGSGGRRGRRERIAPVLQARIRELRRAEREEFRRGVALDSRQSAAILRRDDVEGGDGEGETLEEFIRRTMNGTTTATPGTDDADGGDARGSSSSSSSSLSGIAAGIRGRIPGVLRVLRRSNETILDDAPGAKVKAMAEMNMSKIMMEVIAMPMWVPSSMLGFVASSPDELRPDDVRRVKDEVLGSCPFFFCTSSESMRLAAVFRGNFMSRSPPSGGGGGASRAAAITGLGLGTPGGGGGTAAAAGDGNSKNATGVADPISRVAFDDVRRRLDGAGGGLSDRVQLFLLDDPEWRPGDDSLRQRQDGPGPVILAVPACVRPEQGEIRGLAGTALATLSAGATLFTTFAYAVAAYALNSNFFNSLVNENDMSVVKICFPIAFGVLFLQAAHELGHVLGAKLSKVKIGLPVPLPSLQIGTFGSITPLRSFPGSRRDLLQVALSGPVVTLVLSALFMIAGLNLTVGCAAEVLPTLPVVPVALLKSSFLTGGLVSVLAPKVMTFPLSQPVPVHPLFMVGLSGLVSSALNLLPVGRLDGGRAFSAAFGRRAAVVASLLTLLVMAVAALSGLSSVLIFWGLIVTLFQRQPEIPLRDEITRLDDVRLGAYLSLVVLSLMILLPFPGGSPM